jgi:hypothetical protein
MIQWLTFGEIGLAVLAGLICLIVGLAGRTPSDLTNGATLCLEALLLGQLVVAIVSPATGNQPTGSLLEFYIYLITALIIPPAVVFWGLVERSRWSTVILGVACLAVAIMLFRMYQIWFVQVA